MRPRAILRLLALALLLPASACAPGRVPTGGPDVPYAATPDAVALEMLRLAGAGAGDIVYDLGSGDGRLVIAAARQLGARGVGVEIDPDLVRRSQESALHAGVADRVRFLWQDLFQTEIGEATVVTLYLLEHINLRLRPKLLAELRPGTRVVSHDYGMGDWRPDHVVRVRGPEREHTLYSWIVPADVDGSWRLTLGGPPRTRAGTLRLTQRLQEVTGTLRIDDVDHPLESVTLRGDRLRFRVAGRAETLSFDGRAGATGLAGRVTVRRDAAADVLSWSAERERRP